MRHFLGEAHRFYPESLRRVVCHLKCSGERRDGDLILLIQRPRRDFRARRRPCMILKENRYESVVKEVAFTYGEITSYVSRNALSFAA